MNDTQQQIQPRWYWNVPIVLLIGTLVSLGVRGRILDDARYSWGTFCKQVTYEVDYRWVMRDPDGSVWTTKHWHDGELLGEALVHLEGTPQRLNTRYSLGAVKSWLSAYTHYMYENREKFIPSPPDATTPRSKVVGFTAEMWYRINESRRLRDKDFQRLEEQGVSVSPKRRLFFASPTTLDAPQAAAMPESSMRNHAASIQASVKDDDE